MWGFYQIRYEDCHTICYNYLFMTIHQHERLHCILLVLLNSKKLFSEMNSDITKRNIYQSFFRNNPYNTVCVHLLKINMLRLYLCLVQIYLASECGVEIPVGCMRYLTFRMARNPGKSVSGASLVEVQCVVATETGYPAGQIRYPAGY
jgi:hypothetical protein